MTFYKDYIEGYLKITLNLGLILSKSFKYPHLI